MIVPPAAKHNVEKVRKVSAKRTIQEIRRAILSQSPRQNDLFNKYFHDVKNRVYEIVLFSLSLMSLSRDKYFCSKDKLANSRNT